MRKAAKCSGDRALTGSVRFIQGVASGATGQAIPLVDLGKGDLFLDQEMFDPINLPTASGRGLVV
jgi:hypothetical protein